MTDTHDVERSLNIDPCWPQTERNVGFLVWGQIDLYRECVDPILLASPLLNTRSLDTADLLDVPPWKP